MSTVINDNTVPATASMPSAPSPTMSENLAQRKRDMVARCTEEAKRVGRKLLFGMTTSLALQSVPIPADCDLDPSKLHTVSSAKGKRIRTRNAALCSHVWKYVSAENNVRINQYVYALDLFQAWAQLATHMSLGSLVALGDAIIAAISRQPALAQGRNAFAVHRDLVRFANGLSSSNGKKACVRAAALTMPNVDSLKESEVRLAGRCHGIPCPITNYVVPDVSFRSGAPITLDMAWPEFRVAIEYDGDHHRTDKKQWNRDQEKRNRLRNRGWITFVVTSANLVDEDARAELSFGIARQLASRGAVFDFLVVAISVERLADMQLRQQ